MVFPVWTVRNKEGQFIGSYRAKTAAIAISKMIDENDALRSAFRKSMRLVLKKEDFTAATEDVDATA